MPVRAGANLCPCAENRLPRVRPSSPGPGGPCCPRPVPHLPIDHLTRRPWPRWWPAALTHDRGGRTVLDRVSLTVGPESRIGVIGPNGVGKSTLLQLLAGSSRPTRARSSLDPPARHRGLPVPGARGPRRGDGPPGADPPHRGPAAERELTEAARPAWPRGPPRPSTATRSPSTRFNSLGAADLDARIDDVLDGLGVGAGLADREVSALSGGQEAKVALAGIELSHFDITLLDEPTNDLDFDGSGPARGVGAVASAAGWSSSPTTGTSSNGR